MEGSAPTKERFTTIKNHNTLKQDEDPVRLVYSFTTIKNHNTLKPTRRHD